MIPLNLKLKLPFSHWVPNASESIDKEGGHCTICAE